MDRLRTGRRHGRSVRPRRRTSSWQRRTPWRCGGLTSVDRSCARAAGSLRRRY